jgi:hypothetical protein
VRFFLEKEKAVFHSFGGGDWGLPEVPGFIHPDAGPGRFCRKKTPNYFALVLPETAAPRENDFVSKLALGRF